MRRTTRDSAPRLFLLPLNADRADRRVAVPQHATCGRCDCKSILLGEVRGSILQYACLTKDRWCLTRQQRLMRHVEIYRDASSSQRPKANLQSNWNLIWGCNCHIINKPTRWIAVQCHVDGDPLSPVSMNTVAPKPNPSTNRGVAGNGD